MIVKSFGKINLSLSVKGKKPDGYHTLEMVNLPIELHDTIEISTAPYLQDSFVTCDDAHLNALHHNLCYKGLEAMRAKFGFTQNFLIHIHKEIPFAAGLGGGSSNAAAVMLSIAKILKLNCQLSDLNPLGAAIGADVPYFLASSPAYLTGIGENVTPLKAKNSYEVVLLKPDEGLSTKDVYGICDNFPRLTIDTKKVIKGLEEGDEELIAGNAGNDLTAAAVSLLPTVKDYIKEMQADPAFFYVAMTGSGSSVFGLSTDPKKAREAYRRFEKKGYNVYLTRTMR